MSYPRFRSWISIGVVVTACAAEKSEDFKPTFMDQCIIELKPSREPICREVLAVTHDGCARHAMPHRRPRAHLSRALDTPDRDTYLECMHKRMGEIARPKLTLTEREALRLTTPTHPRAPAAPE